MKNFDEFRRHYSSSTGFWRTVMKDTLIPHAAPIDKELLLKDLHAAISNKNYFPSKPRGYLVYNKGHSVARLVPVFHPRDICVYYYCTKELESFISGNRVPNTYGGWKLGGDMRKQEADEVRSISERLHVYEDPDGGVIIMDESGEYAVESSFDPLAWHAAWGDFTSHLYLHSTTERYPYIAEVDIANFYDSIRLDVLEDKIRGVSDPSKNDEIGLLFHFLGNWNRDFNSYNGQGVGIPQDEAGDCSRILANFYLQDYDQMISDYCDSVGAKYMRYADDQVFFADSRESLDRVICMASLLLLRYGLCINQKKVKIMDREQFEKHFGFRMFMRLGDGNDKGILDEMITEYFDSRSDLRNGGISVLLRILTCISNNGRASITNDNAARLIGELVNVSVLDTPKMGRRQLLQIYSILTDNERKSLVLYLDTSSQKLLHNHFHYQLVKFKEDIGVDPGSILARIEELRKFYPLASAR